jgi:hypothetical protein
MQRPVSLYPSLYSILDSNRRTCLKADRYPTDYKRYSAPRQIFSFRVRFLAIGGTSIPCDSSIIKDAACEVEKKNEKMLPSFVFDSRCQP